jgi:uncharacterized protein YgiM (DUF1202 family)
MESVSLPYIEDKPVEEATLEKLATEDNNLKEEAVKSDNVEISHGTQEEITADNTEIIEEPVELSADVKSGKIANEVEKPEVSVVVEPEVAFAVSAEELQEEISNR